MTVRSPNPSFDAAARQGDGRTNLDLQKALVDMHNRLAAAERALGLGGLNPDQRRKVSSVPPRASVAVQSHGAGSVTVSLTNPEFIRNGGNPLRTPIYHRVRWSTDPTFRQNVTEFPPSTQTHWPLTVTSGTKVHLQVDQSYDGVNWNRGVTSGPVTA